MVKMAFEKCCLILFTNKARISGFSWYPTPGNKEHFSIRLFVDLKPHGLFGSIHGLHFKNNDHSKHPNGPVTFSKY